MMTNTALFFLCSFVTLFLLAYAYLNVRRDSLIELARHQLFSIRRTLFMHAVKGEISFNDESYKLLRSYLNSSLRFMHRASYLEIFVLMFFMGRENYQPSAPLFSEKFSTSLNNLEAGREQIYADSLKESRIIIANHIVHRSPLFSVLLGLIVLLYQSIKGSVSRGMFAQYSILRPVGSLCLALMLMVNNTPQLKGSAKTLDTVISKYS